MQHIQSCGDVSTLPYRWSVHAVSLCFQDVGIKLQQLTQYAQRLADVYCKR